MKIKEGYVVSEIAGSFYAVPVIKNPKIGNGMIKLNETAHFIWTQLEGGSDPESISKRMSEEYDVTLEKASEDVSAFISMLRSYDIVDEA